MRAALARQEAAGHQQRRAARGAGARVGLVQRVPRGGPGRGPTTINIIIIIIIIILLIIIDIVCLCIMFIVSIMPK